ncbi:predicted protein [Naegleria gruberi]|uniref:Ubiquitin-fold modifier-conjugating enzyme 1 n=1 Tax=Naegleria gruberi TaxID=5762 RepID=D2VD80_NAEGR|nr:uncharacterized protein NAEGRDRAFT_33148 [Naegleria gruberi]EFC45186.1 predicted protein [Naegleria gruberi]|eukprot:XP_002677930.1 predicted protein [Naegleria gruberi strain NEG-M]
MDNSTKETLQKIPLLKEKVGPRDADQWEKRLKEEYAALIQYVKMTKENDSAWFSIQSNKSGTKWFGKCWFVHNLLKYEFKVEFEIPVTYPTTAPEFKIPELIGKTAKMYHDGRVCQTLHFHPLWARNVPHFGIAHALALGLGPWLASEVPDLVSKNLIQAKDTSTEESTTPTTQQ